MLACEGYFVSTEIKLSIQAQVLIEQGLVLLRKYDCPEKLAFALLNLGRLNSWILHRCSEAKQVSQEGLEIARSHDLQPYIGAHLLNLGYCQEVRPNAKV